MEQYIVFEINHQSYAIHISQTEKIIECKEPKEIPESSQFLLGYILHEGRTIPVIDLKSRLYNELTEKKKENKIIIVSWKENEIGVLVEKVVGIHKLTKQDQETDNKFEFIKEYISAFLNMEDETIILLNMDKVFTPEQENEILKAKNSGSNV